MYNIIYETNRQSKFDDLLILESITLAIGYR